jgi:hypothetical protein
MFSINSTKNFKRQSGNALIYVLLLIALFAALSFVITRGRGNQDVDILSEEKIGTSVTNLSQHAYAAQQALDRMRFSGTRVDQLDILRPDEVGFNSGTTFQRFYHPDGGGMAYKAADSYGDGYFADTGTQRGWILQKATNVSWTKTSAADVIFSFADTTGDICAGLNKQITGADTIPVATDTIANLFDGSDAPNNNLTTTNCAACENKRSLCIEDSAGRYVFYNIIWEQ